MTLEQARALVGALIVVYFIPPVPDRPPREVYAMIESVDETGIWLLVEDLSRFRCVPGDGICESLHLVEAPRTRTGV